MSVPSFIANYNGNGHTPSDAGDNGFGKYSDISFDDTNPAPRIDHDAWKKEHRMTTGWHTREPRFVHSLKWHDSEGVEHLHVVRSDDLDEVLREVRVVKQFIKAAKAQAEEHAVAVSTTTPEPPQEPAEEPQKGYCTVHNLWMTLHHAKDGSGGQWYSHRVQVDGQWTWCRGGK
jgi:hypothetical protein